MGKSACTIIGLAVALAALATGCTSSPWSASRSPATARAGSPAQGAPDAANASGPDTTAKPDPKAMQEIVAEVRQLGDLDPASRDSLLRDLQNTDPAIWPLLLQQARAAVAYRRRAEQRELAGPGANGLVAANPGTLPPRAWPPGPVPPGGNLPATAAPPNSAAQSATSGSAPLPSPAKGSAAASRDVSAPAYPSTPYPAASAAPGAQTPAAGSKSDGSGRVVSASYTSSGDWRQDVERATRDLESQLTDTPTTDQEVAQHARLRLLYLLAGRRDDAVRPIPAGNPAVREFWAAQLFGLDAVLDTEQSKDAAARTEKGRRVLGEAVAKLGEAAPLCVRNLAFCTKIDSYGCIREFISTEFLPGQEVILYAEVENLTSESTPKGYHTSVRSRYQILDSRNQQVADQRFTTTEEYCRQPRRDYYIGYHLELPRRIYPGKHTLLLTVEDLKSGKVGQASIDLSIKATEGKP